MQRMSFKRWDKDSAAYLTENYGKVSLEEMARHLGKTVNAVRLYALRHRLDDKHQVVKNNRLKSLLEHRFKHIEDFTPSRCFYKETGINQMRYWDIYYGRKPITAKEYAAVADYFGITMTEAFESMQLDLFDNDNK